MATAHVDTLTTLNLTERQGACVQMTRVVRVSGLTGTDPQVLSNALATANVPAANSSPTGFDNLILLERNPALVPGHQDVVDITLEYGSRSQDEYNFVFHVSAALKQVSTQIDRYGAAISSSHTFPGSDPDYGGLTLTQGGDVAATIASIQLVGTGVLATDYPHWKAFEWMGATNSTEWAGGQPATWQCVNVTADPHDLSQEPAEWRFTFNFEFDDTSWTPVAWYIDPRTSKPPPNLVPGVGRVNVPWYPSKDFNDQFPIVPVVV